MNFVAIVLTLALAASAFGATELNVALLRYRPMDKKQTLAPVRLNIAASKLKSEKSEAILSALRANGEAELLFQTTEKIADGKTNHIEKNDLASVVLPGETIALPPITRLSIKFDIHYEPASTVLTWNGSVKWSPQLVDRAALTLLTHSKNGTTLLRPFAPGGQTTGFEYPVLKETAFQSSKIAKDGELILTSTAAEAGATPPEILVLCFWVDLQSK